MNKQKKSQTTRSARPSQGARNGGRATDDPGEGHDRRGRPGCLKRLASEEPGPGRMYAIRAGRHIAALRRAEPNITIEIRWRPTHRGIPGNEKADEWAKLAAEYPDARGVEWKQYADRYGRRPTPLASSLAHLKRKISEKKWQEAKVWSDSRVTGKSISTADGEGYVRNRTQPQQRATSSWQPDSNS